MKRALITLVLIISMMISLSACGGNNQTTTIPPQSSTALENMKALFDNEFTSYTISIGVVSPSGDSANQSYVVLDLGGARKVSYHTEKLNGFVVNSNGINVPDEYKTVNEGVLTEEQSADPKYDFPEFNFSAECLFNYSLNGDVFTASINSTEGFMGRDLSAVNAKVTIEIKNSYPAKIVIEYTTSFGNAVTITYTT